MSNIVRIQSQTDTENPVREQGTSSTTTRTRAREETIIDGLMAYAERAGLPDTPAMRAYNMRLLDTGFELEVLWAVMDETMMAPRPTWHYYAAISLLIVFQNSCYSTANSYATAVKSVHKFRLGFSIAAEADISTTSLEVQEVGAGGNLTVAVSCRQPYL